MLNNSGLHYCTLHSTPIHLRK